jgi:hypothetical protein
MKLVLAILAAAGLFLLGYSFVGAARANGNAVLLRSDIDEILRARKQELTTSEQQRLSSRFTYQNVAGDWTLLQPVGVLIFLLASWGLFKEFRRGRKSS